jgi:Cof subfamily protein (haloacid dehalogenase superfamily)
MKKYLIVLDLDGTLLYDWETLKEETATYLKKIKALGHKLIIATGRPFRSSERYYTMLELDTPIINYNGGLVSWPNHDTFKEVSLNLNKADVVDIFEKNKMYIENGFCEIKEDIYLLEEKEDIMPLLHYFNGAKLHVGPFDQTLPKGPNGFIIVAKEGKGAFIEDYVKTNYQGKILSRNWGDKYNFIIELFTPETNKGNALKYVAETLGFNREDIIAFGDGHNDIEMLEYAGIGVAMHNAHEELLEVADYISPYTNQENAIEQYLETFFKKSE